jgi:hypothetical protein
MGRAVFLSQGRNQLPSQGVVIVPKLLEIASLFFPKETAAGWYQPIPPGGS